MESRTVAVTDDDVEVLDTDAEGADGFATYFAEANKACDREVLRHIMQQLSKGIYISMPVSQLEHSRKTVGDFVHLCACMPIKWRMLIFGIWERSTEPATEREGMHMCLLA